jgi:hypothetical protein
VGVLDKEFHVFGNVYVNDDGGVVLDIELKVVQILNIIT